jgi:hypothetical protein
MALLWQLAAVGTGCWQVVPPAASCTCMYLGEERSTCNTEHVTLISLRHPAGQVILRLLWNPKVHYRVYNSPPLVPILSHILTNYFFNIQHNIILPSTPRYSKWSLSFSTVTRLRARWQGSPNRLWGPPSLLANWYGGGGGLPGGKAAGSWSWPLTSI